MNVRLAYGHDGLEIELSDDARVISPQDLLGLEDETAAIRSALRNPIDAPPLKSLVHPGQKVVVAHSDMTRATPNARLLPVILEEIENAGIRREDITLLNALGTHRRHTQEEMRNLLGDWLIQNYRCIQHNAFDDKNLIPFGVTNLNHPIRLNRNLVEADMILLTGFIEPHLYAGFSGGPKCILPGLAGAETVITNHSIELISHPNARFGITYGNPLWEEMFEFTKRLKNTFIVNVTLNAAQQITNVFAGDLEHAHRAGCEFVRANAMTPVDEYFDVVITTNSGFPLDQNLYQCAKGMVAAEAIVRQGGAILVVAACQDGLPSGSHYERLITEAGSLDGVEKMLAQPGFNAPDQWMLQIQARVQRKADVYVFSKGLSEPEIQKALFIPAGNLESCITRLQETYGNKMCVLPEGPQVIAYRQ